MSRLSSNWRHSVWRLISSVFRQHSIELAIVDSFYGRFGDQEMFFSINFDGKVFYRELWSNLDHDGLIYVAEYICFSEARFSSALYRQNLAFSLNSYSCYTESNPPWIASFPLDRCDRWKNALTKIVLPRTWFSGSVAQRSGSCLHAQMVDKTRQDDLLNSAQFCMT